VSRIPTTTLGALQFRCDGCGATVSMMRPDGRWTLDERAVENVDGWTAVHRPGRWDHYCPDCTAAGKDA
jgi:hypothetical protein